MPDPIPNTPTPASQTPVDTTALSVPTAPDTPLPVPLRKVRSAFRLARSKTQEGRDKLMASDYLDNLRHELSGNIDGPVFVVGSGRSGTSVLLNAIRKTLNWKALGEGHVHPLSHILSTTIDQYFRDRTRVVRNRGHMIHQVDPEEMKESMLDVFRQAYLAQYGTTRFVDKTPGAQALRSLTHMQTIFPEMRVVYAKRRGIEVVRSACLKFPSATFEQHAQSWKETIRTWELVRDRLTVPFVEIDQYDLDSVPEFAVQSLQDLLQLTPAQTRNLMNYLVQDRPQNSGALNRGHVSLEGSGWTDAQQAWFTQNMGVVMADHNWSMDQTYFVRPGDRHK